MNTEPSVSDSLTDAGKPLVSRRAFFSKLTLTLGGIFGALTGLPVIGFLVAPLFQRGPEIWRTVGNVDDFTIGATTLVTFEDPSPLPWAGVTARNAAWLRRISETEFVAFAINCTHLGCPVRWLQDANLFMCPCHGGVFNGDGTVAAGPPPRPLYQYQVRTTPQGTIELLTGTLPVAG